MANITETNPPTGSAPATKNIDQVSSVGAGGSASSCREFRDEGAAGLQARSPATSPKSASRKSSEVDTPKRPRKLTLGQFLNEGVPPSREDEKRDEAFAKLNDKKEMVKRLKNSAPCRHVINKGRCVLSFCSFAHSKEELTPPPCLFGNACKKINCNNIHPGESREDWLGKMNYDEVFTFKRQIMTREPRKFKAGAKSQPRERGTPREEISNRWDQVEETSFDPPGGQKSESRRNSAPETALSPSDKVVIIFPENFSDRMVKKVFEALLDIEIGNIEVRRAPAP